MEVPSECRFRDGQRYQGRNRREHLIHFPAYGWWQPVRDMQIKRGESDREAGLSLNVRGLPYNLEREVGRSLSDRRMRPY